MKLMKSKKRKRLKTLVIIQLKVNRTDQQLVNGITLERIKIRIRQIIENEKDDKLKY